MKKILLITFTLIGFITTATSQTPPIIYVAGDGSGDYNCDGVNDQIEINQALDFVDANPLVRACLKSQRGIIFY